MHGNTAAKPQKIRSLQVLYHPCGNIVKIFGAEHSHVAVFPCLTEARHRAGKLDLRMVMLEYTLLNADALERLLLFFCASVSLGFIFPHRRAGILFAI